MPDRETAYVPGYTYAVWLVVIGTILAPGVWGTADTFREGEAYTVESYYTHTTHDQARLILYATNGETEPIPGAAPQEIKVERGSDRFKVSGRIAEMGTLHVSMYTTDDGRSVFGRCLVERDSSRLPDNLTLDLLNGVVGTQSSPDH